MNDIKKFLNAQDLLNFLKKEAECSLIIEICGLISFKEGLFIYKKINNISSESNFFKISPKDYLDFINENNCYCIFHSHVCGNEQPSDIDILNSNNCCKSFLIYSIITEKFHLYEPQNKDYDVNIIDLLKKNI